MAKTGLKINAFYINLLISIKKSVYLPSILGGRYG